MSILERVGWARREVRGVTRGTRNRVEDPTRVVVVGGGIAGVSAACILAERGVRVTLLERERYLGGRVGAWTETMPDGTQYQMERGFHGFFRQYYNLRNLLRRIDPELSRLRPLTDYPIFGPDGAMESFEGLPKTPPLNLMALIRRTEFVSFSDLRTIDKARARLMLMFDPVRTYADYDAITAREYLDSLRFPDRARQMLFDVFSHSFFNPEDSMSAAEMLMMFHFYFCGNPEGLIFDVLDEPFSDALWKPMERYLESQGVDVHLGVSAEQITACQHGDWCVTTDDGVRHEGQGLVLAVTVPALQRLLESSPCLHTDAGLTESVDSLGVTSPFAVWRLFMDRGAEPERHPFAGTSGMGMLDNISLYERFEGESRRLALRTGGSVVELHGYAVPTQDEAAIKRELLAGLHELYPEFKGATATHESWLLRQDRPAFGPGSYRSRPRVTTAYGNVVLAGDFVKMPFPTALMERAASSGILAANHLLDRWDVRGESLYSVPPRGFMASLPLK